MVRGVDGEGLGVVVTGGGGGGGGVINNINELQCISHTDRNTNNRIYKVKKIFC